MPPFDEENNDQPSAHSQKVGLKKVSSQKSIFDDIPKKPSSEEFEKKVQQSQEKSSGYKARAMVLSQQFKKLITDKTLQQNKSIFVRDAEKEVLGNMLRFAAEVNNDPNMDESEGSVGIIAILLHTCISQRDRLNQLEYLVSRLEKTINSAPIDNKKDNE
jgi:hypothetical protein